jgi:hypothetical protein
MLKEAIEYLFGLGRDASRPNIIRPQPEPDHLYWLHHGDKLTRVKAEPPPRNHKPSDIESLVALTKALDDEAAVSIWYSPVGVVALLDDSTRRDIAEIELRAGPQFSLLNSWAGKGPAWADQATLIRWLRVDLAGTFSPKVLVEALRRLKFRVNQQGESVVDSALPDTVEFKVPVYGGNLDWVEATVVCALEIDAEKQRFALMPVGTSILDAWVSAEDQIGDAIVASMMAAYGEDWREQFDINVYRGRP